ncbi:MAG: hypothetical protein QW575_06870 [Thermoproteota archaeon]
MHRVIVKIWEIIHDKIDLNDTSEVKCFLYFLENISVGIIIAERELAQIIPDPKKTIQKLIEKGIIETGKTESGDAQNLNLKREIINILMEAKGRDLIEKGKSTSDFLRNKFLRTR